MNYEGANCLVCGKELHQDEDIVVCPDCGTPYHRGCYQESGKCVNTELHANNGSWWKQEEKHREEVRREEKRQEEEEQAAARARGEGGPQVFYGEIYDGIRIDSVDPCLGLDPTEEHDGVTVLELSEFVATNRFYYLPLFRLMQKTGKRISLNFIGLLCPQMYFAYRKMWLWTLVTVFLKFFLSIPSLISYFVTTTQRSLSFVDISSSSFAAIEKASNVGWIAFSLLCCLFSNFMYYRFSVRKIRRIKNTAETEQERKELTMAEGGCSFSNMLLAFIIELACTFALFFILYIMH